MSSAQSETKDALGEREILAALRGPLRLPPVSTTYRLGLLMVAAAMVVLPLLYLGLIGLVAYGVYYHAVHNVWILGGAAVKFRLLAYVTPVAVGAISVLFLIKPIFASAAREGPGRAIPRHAEPLLFAFVEHLCGLLRAPVPTRIEADVQINASAGLHLGMVTMTRRDTVLTIGLPLVAGMSLLELTGVLAHEFGHFRQGSGMRVSQLIRRVNRWFARVVYERDEWDEKLVEWTEEGSWAAVIAQLGRLCVWMSRGVLWLLMMAGHAISSWFMRQMELDADRYEILVAGSDTFARTALRLRVLTVASQTAYQELADSWNEGRLHDNLARHIALKADSLGRDVVRAIERASLAETTGWLDTHPSDRARIEQARKMAAPGVFRLRVPALRLFRDFDGVARRVTLDLYRRALGDVRPDMLVSTEAFEEHQKLHRTSEEAARRYFQGLLTPSRMFPLELRSLDHPSLSDGSDDPRQALLLARMQLEERLPEAQAVYRSYTEARDNVARASVAASLLDAGLGVDAKALRIPVTTPTGIERLEARARAQLETGSAELEKWEAWLRRRLTAALHCLSSPEMRSKLEQTSELWDQASRLVACQYELQLCLDDVQDIQAALAAIELLAGRIGEASDPDLVGHQITAQANRLHRDLLSVHAGLESTPYPFADPSEERSCGQYLLASVAGRVTFGGQLDGEALGELYQAGQQLVENYYTLHLRVLGQLAATAERVETAIGLPPLPMPGDEEVSRAAKTSRDGLEKSAHSQS